MPGFFRFPESAQLWTPSQLGAQRNNAFRQVIARRKAEVSPAQVQAELDIFMANLGRQHSDNRIGGARVLPVLDHIVGAVRPAMWLFLGAVGFVLLIACANVAHLALARSERRQREITVRAALGAGRWRLARQLLVESCVLSLCGGMLAFLFAIWGSELLVSAIPPDKVPRLAEVGVDWRVFGFALLISLLAALLFGLPPALRATRTNLASFLKVSARTTASVGSRRFRGFLVVAEMALAVVLLTGAGLLLRSFTRLLDVDPGFRPENVLSMSVSLPEPVYQSPQQMNAFYAGALEQLSSQPGVLSVGLVNWRPLGNMLLRGTVAAEDQTGSEIKAWASKPLISPGYFEAMGIPLRSGRLFTAADRENAPPVAIVSEGLARQLWGEQDPIGRRLNADLPGVAPWVSVVGVVGDIRQTTLSEEPPPAVYLPYLQAPRNFLLQFMTFVVRTQSEPAAIAEALRRQLSEVDPNLPVYQVATMDQIVWASVAEPRFQTLLLGAFSALALLLAAIGIYGVMSYTVASSVPEIGVRLALGARAQDVAGMFVRRGLGLATAGLALGVAGALALTRLLSSMLYSVTPTDPVAFIAALVVLAVAALLASYAPARRAAAVDPAVALRHE
jgi:putative ABC transport system permease protein